MMDLHSIWYVLIAVLIAGYAILDGFDLGVGILHLFMKKEEDKRTGMKAIAPVWDGNEVWLITAGGALFAAFPPVYATVFSGFYLVMMLALAALIFRAVSIDFREKVSDSPRLQKTFDITFGIGSLSAALLFGVAVGNILRGLPIGVDFMWKGSFLGLLNPQSILVGILTVVLFTMHGALYLAIKSEGDLRTAMAKKAQRLWRVFLIIYAGTTFWMASISDYLFAGVMSNPLFWIFFLLLIASVVMIKIWTNIRKYFRAFIASSALIASMIGLAGVSMFPRLAPSNINLAYSLTAYNASSSDYTLKVMLIIVILTLPFVLGYTIFIYRVFKGKVDLSDSY